ncbi:MAG: Gfo/Idh/MocA family oxidoreductase [Bacteroidota bacterium]
MKRYPISPAPISRRQALQRTALLGGALALHPLLAFPPSDKPKLGVALVGLGNYATRQLGPALRQTQYCELRGIVTGTPEKEGQWQQEYGLKKQHTYNYKTYDRLADDPAIDIVYIVLPNFMHAEYTIRALEAGKHVICEKPMGMDVAECEAMIAAAKKANRRLQIGYRLFYEPHHLRLMEESQGAFDGRLRLIEASLAFDMARPGLWRIDKKMGGGGALMDLGPYTIQAARRAAGSLPTHVRAQAYKDDPELYKDIYGTYTFQLRFPNKTFCNSTVSFSGYSDRLHVARGNEYLELQPAFAANTQLALQSWNNQSESLEVAEYQQTTQMDAFARNILDQTPVMASGEEGLIDMQIIGAIKKAIESGEEIAIKYD